MSNPGYDPPANSIKFPSGLLLDPRVSTASTGAVCETDENCGEGEQCTSAGECRPAARWLFVTNANSDLSFNGGSLQAIDLEKFFQALEDEILPAGSAIEPDSDWAKNSPVCGTGDDAGTWCRRVANLPQVIECIEEPFICSEKTVHFGNFPGSSVAWDQTPGDDTATLLIPVRGDPSVTYVELSGAPSGIPDLQCGQGEGDGRGYVDPRRCDDLHRLRFLRNDPDASRLSREPFRILVSNEPGRPLAYVSHQGDPDITLFALDGLTTGGDGRPAMVHQAGLLGVTGYAADYQGGFGLAQRPCVYTDDGDDSNDNAPNSTIDCTRPLVYAAMRWQAQVRTVTAIHHRVESVCSLPKPQLAEIDPDLLLGYCEAQAEPVRNLSVGQLSTANVPLGSSRPILADLGFSRSGNELYVVQSNPGGLLRIDTSIGVDGETLDVPAGQVEVCAQPTSLAIYDDGGSQFGLVTCYRSGELFIVDLASLTVVGLARAGIGPDALSIDLAREVVYVANTLDGTISVIDMSPSSSTRFSQIARIGLQEPYSQ